MLKEKRILAKQNKRKTQRKSEEEGEKEKWSRGAAEL